MAINETDILGGKAIILTNDFDIWQYRCWISAEKKYIRESLKTKDKELAIELAEKKQLNICTELNEETNFLEFA